MNPLKGLSDLEQSVWLDTIRRSLVRGGELERMIREDGLRGMTSNPAIFEKAIAGSTDYELEFRDLAGRRDLDAGDIYERLAVRDVQDAADALRPVHDATGGRDGFVSLEVSPYLARDTGATVEEARRLRHAVARPNVMIKIPATPEGLPAIEEAISEGVNVNVTLLFSQDVYERVALAYLAGLERRAARGEDISRVASVASFFVSRIDTAVDRVAPPEVQGRVAVANARLAYARYKRIFAGPRWRALAARGARTQRLLWASTSAKDPRYRDVLYVEELIGPDTVNTMPPATYDAFRDHGRVRPSIEEGVEEARALIESLPRHDIDLAAVCARLVDEGVRLFADAFDRLLGAIERVRRHHLGPAINRISLHLPGPLAAGVKAALEDWRAGGKVRRLWARDATLWTGGDEARWLGWLSIAEDELEDPERFGAIADEVRGAGFEHVLLIGMGGSSLCPEVMRRTFGDRPGLPRLRVLDSTAPAQVRAAERGVDLARTLFIVASKSGTTLEPNILMQHFLDRVKAGVPASEGAGTGERGSSPSERVGASGSGPEEAGRRFIAITDPGSKLERFARENGFRRVFFGVPSIGGRFSALSNFGMIPAAIAGVDVPRLLDAADEMLNACASCVPPEENPGVVLGAAIGVAAARGRDKLTIATSPGLAALGGWLEQLVAESTGKGGKGVVPVDLERLGPPEAYGDDRLFVYLRLESAPDEAQDAAIEALERAGQPVVRIAVANAYELGEEFFRWEIATAVAGAILGVNPFDQPDVEAAKVAAKKLTADWAASPVAALPGARALPGGEPVVRADDGALAARLGELFGALRPRDYFAVLAFIEMSGANEAPLDEVRHLVRDRKRVATSLGFGPRYLHSTGQLHKGGPNTGVFLMVTCDDAEDLPVPGEKFTFGVVKAAQAGGDFQVLVERGRRALRVHLGTDVAAGLAALRRAAEEALG